MADTTSISMTPVQIRIELKQCRIRFINTENSDTVLLPSHLNYKKCYKTKWEANYEIDPEI